MKEQFVNADKHFEKPRGVIISCCLGSQHYPVNRTAFYENIYSCNFLGRKTNADYTAELRFRPCDLRAEGFSLSPAHL